MEKNKNDSDEFFMKDNPTLFKKYKIKKKLAEGAFGDVYLGSDLKTNDLVAIKVESRKIPKPLLESEAYYLFSLRGTGIPEVLSFGRRKHYNILVEPLLGKSLFDIFNENRKRMPLPDICLIAKQIIDRIQWVHSRGLVHRDIKPDNFLIGLKDPNVIYLIDFGLSKKYKSDKTGKHIKFNFTGKLTGTVRFASANALRGGEQSRRDDLESIAYMIVFFMRGKLPWQGVAGTKKMERYLKIYKMKKNVSPEDLCKSLPKQMVSFMKYIKKLEFEQDPDYNYLRNIFSSILKQRYGNVDNFIFSWIKLTDMKNLKDPINQAIRKESPQNRLYRKIETNLKNKRNSSSDNDSGNKTYQTGMVVNAEKEENYTSKDEGETDDNYKSKKEKSKEGLNTLLVNLNKTLDENVDFEDTEKMTEKKNYDKNKNKKNYTVNDAIDFKNEIKLQQKYASLSSDKNNDLIRDKSQEIRLSNSNNNRKLSYMKIDELEEENNNHENVEKLNDKEKDKDSINKIEKQDIKEKEEDNNSKNKDNNEAKKDKKYVNNKNKDNYEIKKGKNDNKVNNEIKKDKKDNKDNNEINLDNFPQDQNQNIIPIKKGSLKNDSINSINNHKINIDKNINNNIKILNKDKYQDKDFGSPKKENKKLEIKKKNKENKTNKENIKKKENPIKNNDDEKQNMMAENIIKTEKKSIPLNKINTIKNEKNNDSIKKNNKNPNNNNPINQDINNIRENKIKHLKKHSTNHNNNNIRVQKINVEKKPKKLVIENDEGPPDNTKKKKIQKQKYAYNTEVYNLELNNNSIKNDGQLINNINIKNRNLKSERIKTVNNNTNNILDFNKNEKTFNKYSPNIDLDLSPKNSEEIIDNKQFENNDEFGYNSKINKNKIRIKKITKSTNILNNDEEFINDGNIYFTNEKHKNKKNIKINPSTEFINRNQEKIIIDNLPINNNFQIFENKESNNNINNFNNNPNLKNIEFNTNRRIRLVNRNKNPNKTINSNKDLTNSNSKKNKISNAYSGSVNNTQSNQNNNLHNINIHNNISNNIIINNPQMMNSYFRSNSNNPYSGQNIPPSNYILNKRPSHNVNLSKKMKSFNINMNLNMNQIQYMKRPSYNMKGNSNNHLNPLSQITATKRPSYNNNVSISNFLNNTESNKGITKIKKLTNNKTNISSHGSMGGTNIEIIRDARNIKGRGNIERKNFDIIFDKNINNTFQNSMPENNILNNQYKFTSINNINNNINNNMMDGGVMNMNSNYREMTNKMPDDSQNYINSTTNKNNKIGFEKIHNYNTSYGPNQLGYFQNMPNQYNNNPQSYEFKNFNL